MSNPFNILNPGQVNISQVKQIYNMLRTSNNPNALLDSMISQNPQLAQSINLIRANGNYEQVFRSMCQQRGINADEFIKNLNNNTQF